MTVDLEISDLRSFTATVRAGSITGAAHALGLSQPAVSQRIQRLEKAVGERVLIRDARGTRVTSAGETLLAYAERMLSLHDEARFAVEGQGRAVIGRLTLGLLEDVAITALPAALADYAMIYPQSSLE